MGQPESEKYQNGCNNFFDMTHIQYSMQWSHISRQLTPLSGSSSYHQDEIQVSDMGQHQSEWYQTSAWLLILTLFYINTYQQMSSLVLVPINSLLFQIMHHIAWSCLLLFQNLLYFQHQLDPLDQEAYLIHIFWGLMYLCNDLSQQVI